MMQGILCNGPGEKKYCNTIITPVNIRYMIMRKVEPRDNAALAKMIRDVFVEHDAPREGTVFSDPTTDSLYELFQVPGAVLWVAEMDGIAAGCCGIYPTEGLEKNCAELVKFYLSGETRGKGVGRALMQKCVASAREMGYTQLYIESLPHFDKAVSIYEKQGFIMLDKPLGNSGHHGCNIWMLKDLT